MSRCSSFAGHLQSVVLMLYGQGPTCVQMASPMAGSFYRAPAPGEPSFCKEGDKVTKGQTVCIIEAMKLMNEIEVTAIVIIVFLLFLQYSHQSHQRGVCCSICACCVCCLLCAIGQNFIVVELGPFVLTLQADVSGTIVKWLVDNGAQITPGQVSLICSAQCFKSAVHNVFKTCLSMVLACMAYFAQYMQ